ncbi:MAG: outer membrane beta-barrel family protein [Agriterribacter sp.]
MKQVLLLLFVLTMLQSNAQDTAQTFTIKAILADAQTGKPLPFVSVALYKDGKLLKGVLSDSIGRMTIQKLAPGSYYMKLTAIGYHTLQTASLNFSSNQLLHDLGTILLVPQITTLKNVTVTAQKPVIEQKVDGIVFNVESLAKVSAVDAAELLRNIPMVTVDPNNVLSVRGSAKVKILIDGKPAEIYASSAADALRIIRAENISKVEVITNPSAKYDAEGTDAVINIITRTFDNNITNGNIGFASGNRSQNISGDVNSKQGKWLMNADAFYQYYWNRNGVVLERKAANQQWQQQSETSQKGYYVWGGAGVVFSPDSLNTFNMGYRIKPNAESTDGSYLTESTINGIQATPFLRKIITPKNNFGHIFNAGYTGFSKNAKQQWSLLANFSPTAGHNNYRMEQIQDYEITYRENFYSTIITRDFLLQGDYSHSFTEQLKWETGIKIMRKQSGTDNRFLVTNKSNYWAEDTTRSNDFNYRTTIYAAYQNLMLTLKKWGFSSGLRYERTQLNGMLSSAVLYIPSYQNIVPQILINRFINDKSNIKLSYAMTIVRPTFANLNPTINNADSLNIRVGNPFLKPEVTHRYQVSYSGNSLTLFKDIALFFNNNRNSIVDIRTPLPGGTFKNSWENVGRNQRVGVSVNLNWKPSKNFSGGLGLTSQYVWLKSNEPGLGNKGFMHQLVYNFTYALRKGFSIYTYGFFSTRSINLQGYREGWRYYSVTLSKSALNNRLKISLRLDAFLTRYSYIDEKIKAGDAEQLLSYRYQNQNIRLNFSYKIGKKEIKKPRIKQMEENE